jgi:hypothetical protein
MTDYDGLEKKLEGEIENQTSGDELIDKLNGSCIMTPYSKLNEYKSIDEILGENKQFILLYNYEPTNGHWVCMFRDTNNTLNFYDSLGWKCDSMLKDVNKFRAKKHLEILPPYLTKLINGEKVISNTTRLQEDSEDIQTCGCYAVVRLTLKHLSNQEFNSLFKGNEDYSSDYFIRLIYDLL